MMKDRYQYTFSIAGINFLLDSAKPLIITHPFEPFIKENAEAYDIRIELKVQDRIDFQESKELFRHLIFRVSEDQTGYYRIYHDHKEADRPYAVGRILTEEYEIVEYLENAQEFFSETSNTFSHIALEDLLLGKDAMILHASLIDTKYGGILFSGPSGIGKSTQADLWKCYEHAELLNGDRTILRKEHEWNAYGSPYAGSSKCFKNRSAKVRAIVILGQSEKCSIQRLNPVKAFFKVYSGLIINTWNQSYIQKITILLKEMISEIPVYLLECTPTEEAVMLLKNTLEMENGDES